MCGTYPQRTGSLLKQVSAEMGIPLSNSYFEQGRSEIHVECNESATEEDREKFTPNKDITISKTSKKFGMKSVEIILISL